MFLDLTLTRGSSAGFLVYLSNFLTRNDSVLNEFNMFPVKMGVSYMSYRKKYIYDVYTCYICKENVKM